MIECKNCGHGKMAHNKHFCRACSIYLEEVLGQEDEYVDDACFCRKFEVDNLAYVEKCYERQKKKRA